MQRILFFFLKIRNQLSGRRIIVAFNARVVDISRFFAAHVDGKQVLLLARELRPQDLLEQITEQIMGGPHCAI